MKLNGLKLISPAVFRDQRGFFFEAYSSRRFEESFVQDNISFSVKGTIRALHYQSFPGQAKLVTCVQGAIWDVAVDIRKESPTFGMWEAVELNDKEMKQLLIPVGFAHGFCVLSDTATVLYKTSALYNPETERSIRWNDPDLAVAWPIQEPILSDRDQKSPYFKELFGVPLDSRS